MTYENENPPNDADIAAIDLAKITREDVREMAVNGIDPLTIFLPLPSFGVTNSYIDICMDLRDASFAAEILAAQAEKAEAKHDYIPINKTRVRLTISGQKAGFKDALLTCHLLFRDFNGYTGRQEEFDVLCNRLYEFGDNLGDYCPHVPEIVEWYLINLVDGAYLEYEADSPEFYKEQINLYPERQVRFHKSAFSGRLGAKCFASDDSWLVPGQVDLDRFFMVTDQEYRLCNFEEGRIFTVEGKSFVTAVEQIVYFPMNQYFKSKVCASLSLPEDRWPPDRFDWSDASFTHSPFIEHLRSIAPGNMKAADPQKQKCLVHESGSLVCVDDGSFFHLLYDTKPLNFNETKRLADHISQLSEALSTLIGMPEISKCEWSALTDEDFEQLCYDVIYVHPRFDSETIRKLGKSRSRDGGRDIVVFENPRTTGGKPKKWIFQCKLVRDYSSLTGTKLVDLGDMLDQYDAQGFGVMTSTFIDATLYDKMEKVCRKRNIDEFHYSVFELERFLARKPSVKKRYFGSN